MFKLFPRKAAPAVADPRDVKIADLTTERDALRDAIGRKDKRIEGLVEDNTTLSNSHSCLDRVAKKYKAERDAARAELQPFLDRREKAKKNLRQFKNAPDAGAEAQKVRA